MTEGNIDLRKKPIVNFKTEEFDCSKNVFLAAEKVLLKSGSFEIPNTEPAQKIIDLLYSFSSIIDSEALGKINMAIKLGEYSPTASHGGKPDQGKRFNKIMKGGKYIIKTIKNKKSEYEQEVNDNLKKRYEECEILDEKENFCTSLEIKTIDELDKAEYKNRIRKLLSYGIDNFVDFLFNSQNPDFVRVGAKVREILSRD